MGVVGSLLLEASREIPAAIWFAFDIGTTVKITDANIDEDWLSHRGHLNDAKILKIHRTNNELNLQIDDEWAVFEGDETYRGPSAGTISLLQVESEPKAAERIIDEFIDEAHILPTRGRSTLRISFYNGEIAEWNCSAVVWRSADVSS